MAAAARKGGRRRSQRKTAKHAKTSRKVRRLDQPLQERRFAPKTSARPIATLIALGLGGLIMGAGVYGLWLRDEALGALPYAQYLLFAGALLVAVYIIFGMGAAKALRVGDLGVGREGSEDRPERAAWYEIIDVTLSGDVLTVATEGKPIEISLARDPQAASCIVAEARRRIPDRLSLEESDIERIGPPQDDAGTELKPEPPQVAGQQCRNTEKPLMVEKDVRMCARCGVLYHRSGVPNRCLECDAKLR
jgi:hypothetical protein